MAKALYILANHFALPFLPSQFRQCTMCWNTFAGTQGNSIFYRFRVFPLDNNTSKLHEELSNTTKGASVVFLGTMIGAIFLYGVRVILARHLGPEKYGLICLGLTVLSFGTTFALLGLPTGVSRTVAFFFSKKDYPSLKGSIIGSLYISLITGLISFLIIFFFAKDIAIVIFDSPTLVPVLKIFSISTFFSIVNTLLIGYLEGFEDMASAVMCRTVVRGGALLFLILAVFDYGLEQISYAYLFSYLFSTILAFYLLYRHSRHIWRSTAIILKTIKPLFSLSWPLLFSTLLTTIRYQTDRVMLGIMSGSKDVGLYDSATLFLVAHLILQGAFFSKLVPQLTRLHQSGAQDELKQIFFTSNRWLLYLSFPIIAITIFYPSEILKLLFDERYVAASSALFIISISSTVYLLPGLCAALINAVGATRYILMSEVFSAILNIILNYFLIPRYGITGAAVATLFSTLLLNSILLLSVYKFFRFFSLEWKLLIYIATSSIFIIIINELFLKAHTHNFTFLHLVIIGILSLVGCTIGYFCAGKQSEDVYIIKTALNRVSQYFK